MPYPGGQFVSGVEEKLIRRDFECMLARSCHSQTVTGEYCIPVSGSVDPVYDVFDATSWTVYQFTAKAIQEIVSLRDEDLLSWGILEAGDSIFYFSTSQDLSQGYEETLEFIDSCGTRWKPVPRKQKEFCNYALHRIGSSQVAQVVPAKIKK